MAAWEKVYGRVDFDRINPASLQGPRAEMPTTPVELIDSLIKGFILAIYDFLRLTLIGLFLPFFRNTRRVWPSALSTTKRISPLTFLALWILIDTILFLSAGTEVITEYLGLPGGGASQTGVAIPVILVAVAAVALLMDFGVRSVGLMIRNNVRRQLYESLGRIAVANVFVGIFIVEVVAEIKARGPGFAFLSGPLFTLIGLAHLKGWFSVPYLFLFGAALSVVSCKAFTVRNFKHKLLIAVPIILLAPPLLVSGLVWVCVGINFFPLNKDMTVKLEQQFMRCSYAQSRVRASGLLKLKNADVLAVSPYTLAILLPDNLRAVVADDGYFSLTIPVLPDNSGSAPINQTLVFDHMRDGSDLVPSSTSFAFRADQYLGRGDQGQPPIVLSGGQFTSVTITATFNPTPGGLVSLPQGGTFDCRLGLLDTLDTHPINSEVPTGTSVPPP
jgi:hypothetical protein